MLDEEGIEVQVSKPYFIVVEAKRSQALEATDSKAQLLAQLRSLSIHCLSSNSFNKSGDAGRTGALTDE